MLAAETVAAQTLVHLMHVTNAAVSGLSRYAAVPSTEIEHDRLGSSSHAPSRPALAQLLVDTCLYPRAILSMGLQCDTCPSLPRVAS
jgi:hypothetical protein